jgi:hypothetical protein
MGDDALTGGGGPDVFYQTSYDANPYSAGGRDVVTDFARGEDKLDLEVHGGTVVKGFAGLDTNRDGVLDAGDRDVSVADATWDGASRLSTIIDTSAVVGREQVLVVYGVTGLTARDFADGAAEPEHGPAHFHGHEIA